MDTTTPAVSPLRQRMLEDMRMRKLEPRTQEAYIRAVRKLSAYLKRSPDTATVEDLRNFQLHLVDTGTSPITLNATLTGLKFFFDITLGRGELMARMQPVKLPRTVPVVLSVQEAAALLAATRQVLRNALGVACWLTDSRIPLAGTELHFAPPPHADSYRVLFDGPTTFDADTNSLQFDAGYLALPVRRDEAALQQMLERALLLTVRPYRRDRLLVEKVRQALAQHPEHSRNADDLAAWLNMSARTLHRQLQEEGASLQQLKDSVREQRARTLLLRTRKPLKQIANEVGFSNEKSFIRAFKTWTGQAPEAFRHNA